MKRVLILTLCFMLAVGSLSAKIWRINNQATVPADFTNGQAAHNAAISGDTLYFESSTNVYPDFTIRKRLVIMGLGAYLNIYPGYQQQNIANASVGKITIKPGGDGTHIVGLESQEISADTVSNIHIYRNKSAVILKKVNNSLIYHNHLRYIQVGYCSGIAIRNNIVATINRNGSESESILIFNNTINVLQIDNAKISNNIITNTTTLTDCDEFSHNVLSPSSYSHNGLSVTSGGNNLFSLAPESVLAYTQGTQNTDKYYELRIGSHAIGAAIDGGNCGATGGVDPYRFNALQPAIPSIYKLIVPSVVYGNTMPITISTRSNN